MKMTKRWFNLFAMTMCCAIGLVACATSLTIPATTAPAPTSTSMAVLPTKTPRPTDKLIPTPTLTLTPVPTSTPMPTIVRATYVLTATIPTDEEFRTFLAQWHTMSTSDNVAYLVLSKQELDINSNGKSEYFVTGQHGMSGYYAILEESREGWVESYYAEFPGKYAAQAQARIENKFLIVDSLGWTGGTGAHQGIWTQDWIRCETLKCWSVWKEPLVETGLWAYAWVPLDSIAREYSISQIDRPDANTIHIVTRHLLNQVPLLLDEPISLTVRSTMQRVVGPDTESLYRWNGQNFRLDRQIQISPGQEIARVFDQSANETIRLVNGELAALYRDASTISDDNKYESALIDFWGPRAARYAVDGRWGRNFADVAAHNGTSSELGTWLGTVSGSDKGQSYCRLTVHKHETATFNRFGETDVPCSPNFTSLAWADITDDGQDEVLLTTFPPDATNSKNGAGVQRLYIYDVKNGLNQIALVDGVINGVDSAGIRWRTTGAGQIEILAGLPLISMGGVGDLPYWPDLHRRFQVYRWDTKTQSLVPRQIEVEP